MALRHDMLSNAERASELEVRRALAALEVDLPPHDGVVGKLNAMRERLIDGLLARAWAEPAARDALVDQALTLCEARRLDLTSLALPRRRVKALLLAGRPVPVDDITTLFGRDRELVEAELALLTDPAAALGRYERFVEAQRERRSNDRYLRDALCGLALASALAGAPAEVTEALVAEAGALPDSDLTWLPWRAPAATAATLREVAAGWRPRPGESFPARSAAR